MLLAQASFTKASFTKITRITRIPPLVLFLGCSPTLAAGLADTGEDSEAVVVTATRTAQTANETLAPVTVITRKDIERTQAQSIEDLLRGQVGIDVVNNGGQGKATSILLRGTNSDHVLVLIDGIKIGSATSGTAAFQDMPMEMIERIEIVRGPRSSLYGSEALGGVIQIFTRKGSATLRPSLSVGGGSYNTREGSASLSGSFAEQGWYSLGVSGFNTDGFDAYRGKPDEADKDGYRNVSGRVRTGWRFNPDTELEFNWMRNQSTNKFDGTVQNSSESREQVIGASLRFTPLSIWQSKLQISQSADNSDNFLNGKYTSTFNTQRNQLAWQNDIDIAQGHRIVAGADYQNDSVTSTTKYAVTDRHDFGVFTQYLGNLGAHDLQLSVRRDNNEQFGGKTTGSAAWGYTFSEALRSSLSYGTAFKAPTFNQLYYPGYGNADLKPESSRSLDLGVSGKLNGVQWGINAYETQIDNLILSVRVPSTFNYIAQNVDKARIRGIEATSSTHIADWDLAANVDFINPRNDGNGVNQDKVLPRRARRAAGLSADYNFGAWRAGASLRTEGQRYDDVANKVNLGGFTTIDLRGEYLIRKDLRVQLRIENLSNKTYETANLYRQPGRGAYLTLRYQP